MRGEEEVVVVVVGAGAGICKTRPSRTGQQLQCKGGAGVGGQGREIARDASCRQYSKAWHRVYGSIASELCLKFAAAAGIRKARLAKGAKN